MSAGRKVEFGERPPDSADGRTFGFVNIGTTGRKIHLAEFGSRFTVCGETLRWSDEVIEAMSGLLCRDCQAKEWNE